MEAKLCLLFIVAQFGLISNAESASRIDPLVETKVGLIRGLRATDGEYSMFKGIPYAYVNESNPFGQSIPITRLEGTFEAYDDSAVCPQKGTSNNPVGNLDCLHLNIHVPNTASAVNRLPVMVYIFGGGFNAGSASDYSPTYLVQHEVILVSINYRLGPYGFMCLDIPEIPGNQGLKDQHLALKWVKNNIESFGGDVNKITIFGNSAGGASVDLQLLYSEDNIFNQVIMQSGSSLCEWTFKDSDTTIPLKLAEHLGLKTDDLYEALSFLTKVDTNKVMAATIELKFVFRPCVEKDFRDVENFIYDHPINVDLPRVKNIPILAGFNNKDGMTWALNRKPELQKSAITEYLEEFLNFDEPELLEAEELIRHFYFGDKDDEDLIEDGINFHTDFRFIHPVSRSIQKYLENGAETIYQYLFSYDGGRNVGKLQKKVSYDGAAHVDELGYLFGPEYESFFDKNYTPTPEDQDVIDRITTLWANFAKYGNPTPETSELLPLAWLPVTKDTRPYLNIDSEITVESRPFHQRMAFWDLFYKKYYKAQKGYRDDK